MANIRADEITKILREQIENYQQAVAVEEIGSVISVGDGIARIHGLDRCMAGEMLEFPHDVFGIALNLEEDQVGAVLLGRLHANSRRRHRQADEQDYVRACGRGADRTRGESAGPAAGRQRARAHGQERARWSALRRA